MTFIDFPENPAPDEWQRLIGKKGSLFSAIEKASNTPASDPANEDAWLELNKVLQRLEDPNVCKTLGEYLDSDLHAGPDQVDRVVANLRAYVATACVVVAAHQLIANGSASQRMIDATVGAATLLGSTQGTPLTRLDRGWPIPPDTDEVVKAVFQQLKDAGYEIAAAQYWTLYHLNPLRQLGRNLLVPVAGCRQIVKDNKTVREGFLADLQLEFVSDTPGQSFEHPDMVVRPLGKTLIDAINQAADDAGLSVCWQLTLRDPGPTIPLDGESLGGAAAVGCRLLKDGKPYDRSWLLVGKVENGSLASVLYQAEKLAKAETDTKIKHAVVIPKSGENFSGLGLDVRSEKGLKTVCELVSGLVTAVKEYLEWVMTLPDHVGMAVSKGAASSVFVWPDYIKRELKPPKVPMEGEADTRSKPPSRPAPPSEAADYDDRWLYDEKHDEIERIEPWRRGPAQFPQDQRIVLLAPPGQGKTMLLYMTARDLAEQALVEMLEHHKTIDELQLPVVVELPRLIGSTSSLSAAIVAGCRYVRGIERGPGFNEVLIDFLRARIEQKQTWLLLDGLDEVTVTQQDLRLRLTPDREWEGHIIVASRPYGYNSTAIPFDVKEYRLAPFTPAKASELVRLSLADDAKKRSQVEGLLAASLTVQRISQNPLLLTLLCSLDSTELLANPATLTRTELYTAVLNQLLDDYVDWMDCLHAIAWNMIHHDLRRPSIDARALQNLLKAGPGCFVFRKGKKVPMRIPEKVKALREQLMKSRLLIPSGEKNRFIFPHRSFAEFLTASYLAQTVKDIRDGWNCAELEVPGMNEKVRVRRYLNKKAWLPEFEEIVVLTAGCLDDPTPLLEMLADKDGNPDLDHDPDDYFRHRLALAALCLPEIKGLLEEGESGTEP